MSTASQGAAHAAEVSTNVTSLDAFKGRELQSQVEALERDHPTIVAEVRAAGAAAEVARREAVLALAFYGHEQLIKRMAYDGKTTGPEAAIAVVQVERERAHAVQQRLTGAAVNGDQYFQPGSE